MTTTTQKTELELQIEKLTNEHNFKQLIKETIPFIDTLAYLTGHDNDKKRLVARCKDTNEFKNVLSSFPATNENTVIGTARDSYFADLKTPFKVNINNPASPNSYNSFSVEISYMSNDIDVQCTLPIDCIKDYTSTGERTITDSEYHYFTGVSMERLRRMNVRNYNFNSTQISWYGGDKTLKNADVANEIVNSLLNN